jgi:hypothetical protein
METVQVILYAHVEGRCNRALLFVTTHMQVAVRPSVGKPMDQPRIPMKPENDVFVLREQGIVVSLRQAMRMFGAGLQLHEIDDIADADLQCRQMFSKNGLDCRTGHDDNGRVCLQPLVEHVHRAEMESDGIVGVLFSRFTKLLSNLQLRFAKNDAGLAFAFSLSLIDIASSREDGIRTSFTSTDGTLIPQS